MDSVGYGRVRAELQIDGHQDELGQSDLTISASWSAGKLGRRGQENRRAYGASSMASKADMTNRKELLKCGQD
jgi:hypothetical protein